MYVCVFVLMLHICIWHLNKISSCSEVTAKRFYAKYNIQLYVQINKQKP